MLPARIPTVDQFSARLAQREILLWTTKDGREIPLDEMSDDHIANATRVLTLWKSRALKDYEQLQHEFARQFLALALPAAATTAIP